MIWMMNERSARSIIDTSRKKQKESTHKLRRQRPKSLEEFEILLNIREIINKKQMKFCPGCGAELVATFGQFEDVMFKGIACPQECNLWKLLS
jgi:hypothetical protein